MICNNDIDTKTTDDFEDEGVPVLRDVCVSLGTSTLTILVNGTVTVVPSSASEMKGVSVAVNVVEITVPRELDVGLLVVSVEIEVVNEDGPGNLKGGEGDVVDLVEDVEVFPNIVVGLQICSSTMAWTTERIRNKW